MPKELETLRLEVDRLIYDRDAAIVQLKDSIAQLDTELAALTALYEGPAGANKAADTVATKARLVTATANRDKHLKDLTTLVVAAELKTKEYAGGVGQLADLARRGELNVDITQ